MFIKILVKIIKILFNWLKHHLTAPKPFNHNFQLIFNILLKNPLTAINSQAHHNFPFTPANIFFINFFHRQFVDLLSAARFYLLTHVPTLQWRLKKLKIFKSKISLHLFFDLLEHDFHLFFLSPSSWKERKKLSPKRESEKLNFFTCVCLEIFLLFKCKRWEEKSFSFLLTYDIYFFWAFVGAQKKVRSLRACLTCWSGTEVLSFPTRNSN